MISGNKIEDFKRGWAVIIFSNGERSHYLRRYVLNPEYSETLCGMSVSNKALYGEGTYPRCKRCEQSLAKHRWDELK